VVAGFKAVVGQIVCHRSLQLGGQTELVGFFGSIGVGICFFRTVQGILTPRNDESAGKIKSRKIMPGNQYIKTILCQAAWGAVKVRNSSFSKWFWSHQGHIGQKKAIIAVSRKLLKMIYILLEKGQYYDPNYSVKATE
ncbi:MAG: transposase, partial [Clostridia bacterium]|nr:transposase [Clostridia bacterium]